MAPRPFSPVGFSADTERVRAFRTVEIPSRWFKPHSFPVTSIASTDMPQRWAARITMLHRLDLRRNLAQSSETASLAFDRAQGQALAEVLQQEGIDHHHRNAGHNHHAILDFLRHQLLLL